jgi:catechol 2,3-dioxygenase-like lactoylglutathione lyase family enzyme
MGRPGSVGGVRDECPVRVALRVDDVGAAAALYLGLGFALVGEVPGPDGVVVMAILRRGPLQLLVDALVGIPFPDNARERRTKAGPRGLGVIIGLEVDDVDRAARQCRALGCVIGTGPVDAPWGERYVEFEDPYGYAWKLFQPLDATAGDGLRAVSDAWFGHTSRDGESDHDEPSAS